ncbi:MAG: glycosyltransferase family 4 protein, partial [Lacipirellulaceae bacterium]
DLEGHAATPKELIDKRQTYRIGYLARICHEKGLHLLVEACEKLATETPALSFELHAAGYLGAGDRRYLSELEKRIAKGPLSGRFTYRGELTREEKIEYLQSLDIMSTPTVYVESKGLPVLESLANGTPVVVPAHGTFPELVDRTGGGLLHTPLDTGELAARLRELLTDHQQRQRLGEAGHAAVREHFHAQTMAEQTLELYRKLAHK